MTTTMTNPTNRRPTKITAAEISIIIRCSLINTANGELKFKTASAYADRLLESFYSQAAELSPGMSPPMT